MPHLGSRPHVTADNTTSASSHHRLGNRRSRVAALALVLLAATLAVSGRPVSALGPDITLVSNLGQADASDFAVIAAPSEVTSGSGNSSVTAVSFTTGFERYGYILSSVTLYAKHSSALTTELVPSLHADSSGVPGSELHALPLVEHQTTDWVWREIAAQGDVLLDPGTTYWLVFESRNDDSSSHVRWTTSSAEDAGAAAGWSIGNAVARQIDGGTWSTSSHRVLEIKIEGSVSPPHSFSEPAGVDLPASAATTGLVITRSTATGTMSDPADDGPSVGDWFRLETTRGKKYRVEVKFGASPTRRTGGGIEVSGVGGQWDWDHNRDDGRSYVEFTAVGTHYLKVFSKDFLNVVPESAENSSPDTNSSQSDGSRTTSIPDSGYGTSKHFGAYTVDLTDISDIKPMVGNLAPPATKKYGSGPNCDDYNVVNGVTTTCKTGRNYHFTEPSSGTLRVGSATRWERAQSFRTGPNTAGYNLKWVEAVLTKYASNDITRAKASLHSDISGSPGTKVFDFVPPLGLFAFIHNTCSPADPDFCYSPLNYDRFHVPSGQAALSVNTTYWIVFAQASASAFQGYAIEYVATGDEDGGTQPGWSLGDKYKSKNDTNTTWSDADSTSALRVSVSASSNVGGI
ncbi:choice-of-anchor R domain-containing protein [Candidatus Poriferisodalis sp.]|uniref:choice-of-anchor R domain-containing protein n=1 Tax=Candidatus Poriferisodalis sp. TaxID=3101277 RepID=UPI003B02176A